MVHRCLDQRIAGKSTDNVQARHIGLVGRADLRQGGPIGRRKSYAAGFDELARRGGAQSGDDAVAIDRNLPVRAVEGDRSGIDAQRLGAKVAGQITGFDGVRDQREVAVLGPGEFPFAVDNDDVVLRGQRDCVLDRRVARADHDNGLGLILFRIVELVLHVARLLGAGHVELAQVALQADRQNHLVGGDILTVPKRDPERFLLALNPGDFSVVANIDVKRLQLLVPVSENIFANAVGERKVAAQRQDVRRRHHQLASLILEDRIGSVVRLFQQDVRLVQFRSPPSGAQTAWA